MGSDSGFHKRGFDTTRYKRSRNLEERNELALSPEQHFDNFLLLKAFAEPPRMKFMTYRVALLDPQTKIHNVEGRLLRERISGMLGFDLEPCLLAPAHFG